MWKVEARARGTFYEDLPGFARKEKKIKEWKKDELRRQQKKIQEIDLVILGAFISIILPVQTYLYIKNGVTSHVTSLLY